MKIELNDNKLTRKLLQLLMLSSCVFLFNCSEDLTKELYGQRTPIKVTASVEELGMPFTTRTVTTGLNNGAFTISETAAMNKVRVHIGDNDHAYTFSGTAGNATTELTEDEPTYFPKTVSSVNVYGHYPYSDGFSTVDSKQYFTIQADQTTEDGYLKSDLMTADNSPAVRSQGADGVWTVSDEGAHLDFKHQMAKIIVNVKTDETAEGGSGLTIKRVVINDVKPRVQVIYNATTGQYTIDEATTDAEGHTYDLEVLGAIGKNEGEATVLIPSQRYKVPDDKLTDYTVCQKFITIYATAVYKDANQVEQTDENAELTYFFKGNGKLFKPGYVYTVTLRPGKNDYLLKDEYNVPGVELAKWADDGEKTNVHVIAAEEKLELAVDKISTTISDVAASKVYTGHEHTLTTTGENPELTITLKDGGAKLIEGDDYELHYSNNVNVGQATVTIMGIGRYAGNVEKHFNITQKSINHSTVNVSFSSENTPTYDGSGFQPTPIIYDEQAGKELTRYDYATTEWMNNVNAGDVSASVTITGTGNYKDSRTEYFSINKTAGSVTFADEFDTSGSIPTLTLIKPKGHEFDYIDAFKDILGDGKLAAGGVVSSDNSVVEVTQVTPSNTPSENKWKFHVKKSGTVTLTFTMTNKTEGVSNYDYTGDNQPTCRVVITDGPALPIEYVADYDMWTNTISDFKMAEDNKSMHSCWFTWGNNAESDDNPDNPLKKLCKQGLTKGSEHFHVPATYEWRSIFAATSYITWGATYLDAVETGVAFGVTRSAFNKEDGSEYSFHMPLSTTKTWRSDYYSPTTLYPPMNEDYSETSSIRPSRRCYVLRFKGTTYCSAWRYDWIWTTDSNSSLTENSVGRKSVVVRVIYLGPSFKYDNDYTDLLDETKFNWDGPGVIKRCFPMTGTASGLGANAVAQEANASDRPEQNWYWSTSMAPNGERYSVRLTDVFLQGDQHHTHNGFSVRLFKDYVQ